ncbi:FUSC family protein [Novosphingobium guangzhouense]|uniref:Fusaric acid resistance protein n=1 Tax=Novosphingobium guangzhouense TaxID=1850347 RepID=A0A2K2G667_9SPHN|nr:FUSC family protein [Novosphingobium guangzhouense]PNU06524.1 Fusaric acid resistance protein [Novosphingobium guangzhouense]
MNARVAARWGIPAAIFSLKAFAAAILAAYISFSIGLERPYWAFLTAYIVAAPLAGAVVSKALFRVVGTFVGAAASVLMVPPLAHSPELLTLALAAWLGLCVFVSLLDRTPRGYMFVLAGYTACLIVLPTVSTPDLIFEDAALRVQEITLGILCGSLIHGVVLPGSVSTFLLGRVAMMLRDAERWTRDSLELEPDPSIEAEKRRLAQDVTELHQLSIHLPFETSRLAPRVRTVRALQDQLSQLMPLGAAVADRIAALRERNGLSEEAQSLLADTREWLANIERSRDERERVAVELKARCAALEPQVEPDSDWDDMLLLSLGSRLSSLIDAHLDCRDLAAQLGTRNRKPVSARIPPLLEGRRNREVHRDYRGALRGAMGAALTIILGCTLWIGSGWNDGATAVMLAGVFLALFSASDNPLLPLWMFFNGTLIATIIGMIYAFAILPRIDGFPMLAMSLAPPLLVLGSLMHSPRYAGVALPALLGMGSPFIIAVKYNDNFVTFADSSIAQLLGVLFAITMARLLQTAGLESAIRRTLLAGWRDIAERANVYGPPDVRGWVNRMLDRIALLNPRLALSGKQPGAPLYDVLRDLRTGVAIGELRELRLGLPPARSAPLNSVLADVANYYRRLEPDHRPPAAPELLADIDSALRIFTRDEDRMVRRKAALALVSLRRNIFPEAAALKGQP